MPPLARFARPAEWIFAVCVLVWLGEGREPFRDLLTNRALPRALLVVSLWLLVRRRRELRALLAACWPVLALAAVAALSPLWSLDPRRSFRAALAISSHSAFGLWLALRFDLAGQQRALASALAFVVVASACLALLAPEIGVMQRVHPGAWAGLYTHKNALGAYLGLAVLACGLLACAQPALRAWSAAAAALAAAMFVPVRSVGGAAAFALAGGAVASIALLRRLAPRVRVRAGIGLAAALAAVAALAVATAPTWLAGIGREPTLTRRTEIWALVIPAIREHPWLGHGADAFWQVAATSREIVARLGFRPGSAHDGFLEILLELGVLGLAAFCIPLAVAMTRALRLAFARSDAAALWPLAFLAWYVTSNLVESGYLIRGPLGWAVFVATAATLARDRARAPRRASA